MLRVMIVEDEDMIRKGLVFTIDWLSMDCVVVAEASNGQEGYERILEYKPWSVKKKYNFSIRKVFLCKRFYLICQIFNL